MLLGAVSDLLFGKRAPVLVVSITLAGGGILLLTLLGEKHKAGLFAVIFFVGLFVSGCSHMITITASTDLAKQDALRSN